MEKSRERLSFGLTDCLEPLLFPIKNKARRKCSCSVKSKKWTRGPLLSFLITRLLGVYWLNNMESTDLVTPGPAKLNKDTQGCRSLDVKHVGGYIDIRS